MHTPNTLHLTADAQSCSIYTQSQTLFCTVTWNGTEHSNQSENTMQQSYDRE